LIVKITRTQIEAEEFTDLVNRFYKLNGERQRVAHGVWVPFLKGGMVQHVSRSSLKVVTHEEQAEALEKWAEEASTIRTGIMKFFVFPAFPY
jgi:hypothetical protein